MGYFADSSNVVHGYLFDGTTYTTIDPPGSTNTVILAASGNDIVGYYVSGGVAYGFLYNISTATYTTVAPPGLISTSANGISGNDVVGFYADGSNVNHGYLYNISTATYTTFDLPGSTNTYVVNSSGNNVVGYYAAGGVDHGFVYNISTATFTTFDPPGTGTTLSNGISSNDVVGFFAYPDSINVNHGYLYNISTATYTTFDPPGSTNTYIAGMSGSNVVGNIMALAACTRLPVPACPRAIRLHPCRELGRSGDRHTHGVGATGVANGDKLDLGSRRERHVRKCRQCHSHGDGHRWRRQQPNTSHVSFDVYAPSQTVLTDTTPVVTDKAVDGMSTGNVVLATFKDAIPASGLFTDLTVPGATATYVKAVSGNDVLGQFLAGGVSYGFLYNILHRDIHVVRSAQLDQHIGRRRLRQRRGGVLWGR